jgi:4-amino-4-deoxy-L-arabinose transferase-like glycosyltransferase
LASASLGVFLAASAGIFVAAQLTIDQVSRAGPDQLVAAIFFVACALLLRLLAQPGFVRGALFGSSLGIGFLAKAVFLPLGGVILLVAVIALWPRCRHRALTDVLAGAAVFVVIAGSYGAALSSAVGHPTLGEAGAINYAWHVDRLHKWVHWQGGVDPADKAWPKPIFARFAHWQSDPPDFGRPIHPTTIVGSSPRIYVFHEIAPGGEVRATYVPYYDPPFWYAGYKHVVRWRYVVIALGKNTLDLVTVLVTHTFFGVALLGFVLLLFLPTKRRQLAREATLSLWPLVAISAAGICIFLPVHLEGRYLSAFLAVLAVIALMAAIPVTNRAIWAWFFLLIPVGVIYSQLPIWHRPLAHWTPVTNVEWRAGQAVAALGLPPGSQVAAISWDPNLHCDWAYMAHVRITSEIATLQDENAFWALPPARQAQVLSQFQAAGARAVLTWDKPQGPAPGWRQLPGVPMWVYRF